MKDLMKVAAMKKHTMKNNIMFIQKRKNQEKIKKIYYHDIDGGYDDVDDNIDNYMDDKELSFS